jgi:hypothetical protein
MTIYVIRGFSHLKNVFLELVVFLAGKFHYQRHHALHMLSKPIIIISSAIPDAVIATNECGLKPEDTKRGSEASSKKS